MSLVVLGLTVDWIIVSLGVLLPSIILPTFPSTPSFTGSAISHTLPGRFVIFAGRGFVTVSVRPGDGSGAGSWNIEAEEELSVGGLKVESGVRA